MSTNYLLLLQTVDGIPWTPGAKHRKKPNLYVVIHQDGVDAGRTNAIRKLEPQWGHSLEISAAAPSTRISLRLLHHSSVPFGQDECLGQLDTDIGSLLRVCGSDGEAKVVPLELTGLKGELAGKPAGTISVCLTEKVRAGRLAIEHAQRKAENAGLGPTPSALMDAGDTVSQAVSATGDLASSLYAVTSKLDIIVKIGDQIATIHPYVNIAWTVLTSVYKAVQKQQATDDKLKKLIDAMVDTYSFVEDVQGLDLAQKMRSLETQTLAIVKQTVECALFIQEYTVHGFSDRVVRNTLTDTDQKINDFTEVLRKLKESFHGRLTVQGLFLAVKAFDTLQGLEQSDTLSKLNPVDMNGTLRSGCLPGTRREILDDITGWLSVPSDSNILWLSGVAGSGKSTISTTISETFRGLDRLGAFLFFDRNDQARSHPAAVIRTIAYCLARFNPHMRAAISAAIHRSPDIIEAQMATQFRGLLLDPLLSVEKDIPGPVLIILDALDECGDPESRAMLLSLLSNEFSKLPRGFCILITSRREPDITYQFRSLVSEKRDLDTAADSNTRDVNFFIRHEMAKIQHTRHLAFTWPGEDKLRTLISLSDGLFIWASTAIKFINTYSPDNQLNTLMAKNFKLLMVKNFTGGGNLNSLYEVAIRGSQPWETDETFTRDARAILACLVLGRVPMTEATMDILLFSGTPTAGGVLGYLGCVVQWSPGKEARIMHASFADYLTDPTRSGGKPWLIDPNADHHSLSVGCLRVLQDELRFNMCQLESSHHRNVDVPDLSHQVAKMISPQLTYATCFWGDHVQGTAFNNTVLEAIDNLLHHQFLFWLEALSLLGQIAIAQSLLEGIARYAKEWDNTDFQAFVSDTIKFVGAFAPVIAQSTPHIYLSALPFTPRQSKIAKSFAKSFSQTLRVQGPLCEDWLGISKILWGHTDSVQSVSFSPDGKWVASGSRDYTVRVWDVQTGVLVAGPFEGHTNWVTSVHFSPDGARIASGSWDKTVCVWDAKTGALLAGPFEGHTGSVRSVNFSPDGTRIASGSKDNTVCVWDAQTGVLVAGPFEGHTGPVCSVQFSPDGTQIASGSEDCTLRVWDANTEVLLSGPFVGHMGKVASVCFSPDGARIASGSWDRTVCVWDTQSSTLLAGPFKGHTGDVNSVDFSPNGAWIASGSDDNTVYVWDSKNGSIVSGPLQGHYSLVNSVCFSPDGVHLASGSRDHTVRIWDVQTSPQVVGAFEGHTKPVTSVAFSPDSTQIISGCSDNTLCVWDATTGTLVAGPVEGHTGNFSPDGARIVSGSQNNTVHVWDSQTGALIAGPFEGHADVVVSVHFSPDGTRIASRSHDKTVLVWDASTDGIVAGPFTGHTDWVRSVHFSPDGARVASGADDRTVRVWDAHTGALVAGPFEGHTNIVTSVHFSPDGTRIASGSWDTTVRVWDAQTGALVAGPFEGHTHAVSCVKFSPDGGWVASGSYDKTVCVWDAQTGVLVAGPFEGHTQDVNSIDFSPDGTRIVSGSDDTTVRVWELNPSVPNPLGDAPQIENDWVLNSDGDLMCWVPPWLQRGLYLPHNTLVICSQGTTKLDLSRFVYGTEWEKCIDPKFRDTTSH